MIPIKDMTQAELAAYVQSHLRKNSIQVVLSGGASVSYYSDNRYVSKDLDLVIEFYIKWRTLFECMQNIGFYEEGRYFKHPDTNYFVEFPPGPLTVGSEPVRQITEIELSTGILRLISPTDCVKDRLSAFYHWNDQQCLYQAALVAKNHKIDLEEIERWSRAEGMEDKFESFVDSISGGDT